MMMDHFFTIIDLNNTAVFMKEFIKNAVSPSLAVFGIIGKVVKLGHHSQTSLIKKKIKCSAIGTGLSLFIINRRDLELKASYKQLVLTLFTFDHLQMWLLLLTSSKYWTNIK